MRFGLSANPDIPKATELARRVVKHLKGDHEVVVEKDLAKTLRARGTAIEKMAVDVLVTVGGDGTILRALQRNRAPLLGINAGVLGYLAEVRANNLEAALDRVARRDYRIEERLRVKTAVNGRRLYDALNEVVLHTASVSKMRHFEVLIDGQTALEVRADAVILATPTGSTSYAMSVGGPILDPRVEAFVVAPLAAFKLNVRPLVVPATAEVRVRLKEPKPCALVVDGQQVVEVSGKEEVVCGASERPARLIRFRNAFYRRLNEKLVERL